MFDAALRSDAGTRLARADGELSIRFARRGQATVLGDLFQRGSLYARFPRGPETVAVTLNNGGGIAGGDRLATEIAWDQGTSATITTAAAERVYRARPADPPARVRTELRIEAGSAAEWLPQETILFDGARLDRVLSVRMHDRSAFLGLEALVFGRTARGERYSRGFLADRISITRGGRTVLHDAVRLEGDITAVLDRPAVANAAAVATMIRVAADAEQQLEMVRAALPACAAASAWDGMLVARFVAPDGAALRRAIVAVLEALRPGPPPRTWLC
jgi:urease accessory protein